MIKNEHKNIKYNCWIINRIYCIIGILLNHINLSLNYGIRIKIVVHVTKKKKKKNAYKKIYFTSLYYNIL